MRVSPGLLAEGTLRGLLAYRTPQRKVAVLQNRGELEGNIFIGNFRTGLIVCRARYRGIEVGSAS